MFFSDLLAHIMQNH